MNGPFNEQRYRDLLEGLEISEVRLSEVKTHTLDFRIEAEHYQKQYNEMKAVLLRHKCTELSKLVAKPIQTGHTPSMKDNSFYGGNIKFIKTDNLRNNEIKYPFSHYLSAKGNNEIKRTELQEDDIITTIIGATYDVIARSCIIRKEILPANINQNIARIQPDKKKVNPEYLNIYLNTKYGKMFLEYLSRQMEQVNLNCEEVGNVMIPLFSCVFQKEIARLVRVAHDSLYESKDTYAYAERILLQELGLNNWQPSNSQTNEKSLKESFLSSGRLDAEHYQMKYDELEARIRKVPYKTTAEIQLFNARGVQPDYVEEGCVSVVNSKHILEDGLDYDNFERTTESFLLSQKRAQIGYGDILIYTTGANIGRTQAYLKHNHALASNHVNILRVKGVNPIYLALVLNSPIGRLQTEKLCTGSAQAEIYPNDIERFIVPILDETKQETIAAKVQDCFALKMESKRLLNVAKEAVEIAISDSEEKALQYIKENENGESLYN